MQSLLEKFSLKTVVGFLVAGLVILFQAFGVNIRDLEPSLSEAIANFANAASALVGLGLMVWGHIQLAQKHADLVSRTTAVTSDKPTPKFAGLNGLLCVAALGLTALSLTACGGTIPSPSPSPSPAPTPVANAIESALPLIRTGSAVATGAVLDFAVQQSSTRTRLANEMYSAASSIYSLTGGTLPTPAQFQSNILAFGGSQTDANYAQFSTAIAGLYAAYFPKLQTGDTKTATDLLNAIAGGIEDATASYVTTPAPTASASGAAQQRQLQWWCESHARARAILAANPSVVTLSF